MLQTEIRPISNREELEQCFDLWAEVFPDGRAFFQDRLDFDSGYDFSTTWAAYVGGHLAAAIQIFPYKTAVHEVSLKIGGIGNVATNPSYRRMGLSQAILRAACRWMQARGYDASLLFTGIHSFYEQVGFVKGNGTSWTVDRFHFASLPQTPQLSVRPFAVGDTERLIGIYESWRKHRPEARLRTKSYWEDMSKWLRDETWVVESDGQTVGYLRGQIRDGNAYVVREFCYVPEHADSTFSLLQFVLDSHPEARVIHMGLPGDHAIVKYLIGQDVSPESRSDIMWKVVDTGRLMRKLQPVFSRRATAAFLKDTERVLLQSDDGDICLLAGPDGVDILDAGVEHLCFHHGIRMNSAQLMQCLFEGLPEIRAESSALKALFPFQAGVLWDTDHF